MNHQPFVAWLISNEYSPVTIQKYTRALARFFAETGAGPAPAAALCAPRTRHPVAAHSVRHKPAGDAFRPARCVSRAGNRHGEQCSPLRSQQVASISQPVCPSIRLSE